VGLKKRRYTCVSTVTMPRQIPVYRLCPILIALDAYLYNATTSVRSKCIPVNVRDSGGVISGKYNARSCGYRSTFYFHSAVMVIFWGTLSDAVEFGVCKAVSHLSRKLATRNWPRLFDEKDLELTLRLCYLRCESLCSKLYQCCPYLRPDLTVITFRDCLSIVI
jgi:hypothetical protein